MADTGSQPSAPRRVSNVTRALRFVFAGLATLFASGVVVQVFLAGLGVLMNPAYFAWHGTFAHMLELILLLALIAGALGRVGWAAIGLNLLLFAIFTLQYVFLYALEGAGRGLHVVNALVLFTLGFQLSRMAWGRALRQTPTATPAPTGGAGWTGWVPLVALVLVSAGSLLYVADRTGTRGRSAIGGSTSTAAATGAAQAVGSGQPTAASPTRGEPAPAGAPAAGDATSNAEVLAAGALTFAGHCSTCHGDDGQGGVGPRLARSDALADADHVLDRILNGQGIMPAWGAQLSDAQVAAVASYVRGSWGNDFGIVTAEQVVAHR